MNDGAGDPRATLGVAPEASEDEVRRAYRRLKAVYASDATYGLLAAEDVQRIRDALDAAYAAVMDPERRRARQESAAPTPLPTPLPAVAAALATVAASAPPPPAPAGASPAEGAPPGQAGRDEFEEFKAPVASQSGDVVVSEAILRELVADSPQIARTAPAVAEAVAGASAGAAASAAPATPSGPGTHGALGGASPGPAVPAPAEAPSTRVALAPGPAAAAAAGVSKLDFDLRPDTPVTGDLLRRVRETRGIDVRDVAHHTKVSVTQLMAIEREAFHSLPAAVYVRGFVHEYARYLRFPDPARAAKSYADRYRAFLGTRE